MSKSKKVRLCEILNAAGLNGEKALRLVGYPHVVSIQILESGVAPDTVKVEVNEKETIRGVDKSGVLHLQDPALPVENSLLLSVESVVQFNYSEKSRPKKILALGDIAFSPPLSWPVPRFLKNKYPLIGI